MKPTNHHPAPANAHTPASDAVGHTPGPWAVQTLVQDHNGYDWPTFAVRSSRENYCLAVVGDVDRATAEQNEANARLIAAAPELLAALVGLLAAKGAHNWRVNADEVDCFAAARAAVEKATATP